MSLLFLLHGVVSIIAVIGELVLPRRRQELLFRLGDAIQVCFDIGGAAVSVGGGLVGPLGVVNSAELYAGLIIEVWIREVGESEGFRVAPVIVDLFGDGFM